MVILKTDLTHLRNNGHFQFYTELYRLMNPLHENMSMIEKQYTVWCDLYFMEDATLKKIRKSAITEDIVAANADRDRIFRGMAGTNSGALNHFSPEVAASARRLQVVIDAYGNVTKMPLDEKTSAIHNLVSELTDNYQDDIKATGLSEWVNALRQRNNVLAELVSSRDSETADRVTKPVKEIRPLIDEAYRALAVCIEALWIMAPEGEIKEYYTSFIRRLNAVIERYNNSVAHRRGNSVNDVADSNNSDKDDDDQQTGTETEGTVA